MSDASLPPTPRPSLTTADWDDIAACFEAALALPAPARAAFVAQTLGSASAARAEVEALLAEEARDVPLSIEPLLLAGEEDTGRLPPGTRVGAWRIVALLGEGGMGEVYRAERVDGDFEQTVAIKLLRPGLQSADLVRRSRAERQILARLVHPSIVAILDGGTTDDGRPYLVMPHVDGLPITVHCDTHALSLEQRLALFLQVAAGVQFAHSRLVVHRDIKPSNILVTARGEARLLDFGIAKLLTDAESVTGEETRSAMRLLTPEHAAPEQVRGEPVTTATDVYALGVLLYQLLTGTRPHRAEGRALRELEREILEEAPVPPSRAARGRPWERRLPGELDRIVLMALRKEPDRRYASAAQLAEDVEHWLAGRPVRAERDTLAYRMRKFVQRNRVAVVAGSVFALMLTGGTVMTALQSARVARERDLALRQRATTRSVVALLTSIFEQTNPAVAPAADTLRVAQLLSIGTTLVDSLAGEPALQAEMWGVLGKIHVARGRRDLARQYLQRAYDLSLKLPETDSLSVALLAVELAKAVGALEGEQAALPLLRDGLARLRRAPGVAQRDVLLAETELAARESDVASQRQLFDRILAQQAAQPGVGAVDRAAALHARAVAHLGAGELREAVTLLEEVVRLLEAQLPPGHTYLLAAGGNLAVAHSGLGDFERAEQMSRTLLHSVRAAPVVDTLILALAVERLATVQALRGFFAEAEAGFREALALERQSVGSTHWNVGNTLTNLALLAEARGRHATALLLMDSSLALPPDRRRAAERALLRVKRAGVLLSAGRYDDAARELATSGPLVRQLYAGNHEALAELLLHEGRLALVRGDDDEAAARFAASEEHARRIRPAGHATVLAAACGRGIALAGTGDRGGSGRTESAALLDDACARYARSGMPTLQLVLWADSARQRVLRAGER